MSSEKPQSLRTAAQNRNLQTLCNFQAMRSPTALLSGSKQQTSKQNNSSLWLFLYLRIPNIPSLEDHYLTFFISLKYKHLWKRKHTEIKSTTSLPTGTNRLGVKQGKMVETIEKSLHKRGQLQICLQI